MINLTYTLVLLVKIITTFFDDVTREEKRTWEKYQELDEITKDTKGRFFSVYGEWNRFAKTCHKNVMNVL